MSATGYLSRMIVRSRDAVRVWTRAGHSTDVMGYGPESFETEGLCLDPPHEDQRGALTHDHPNLRLPRPDTGRRKLSIGA